MLQELVDCTQSFQTPEHIGNVMQYFQIQSQGNALDFGNLTNQKINQDLF